MTKYFFVLLLLVCPQVIASGAEYEPAHDHQESSLGCAKRFVSDVGHALKQAWQTRPFGLKNEHVLAITAFAAYKVYEGDTGPLQRLAILLTTLGVEKMAFDALLSRLHRCSEPPVMVDVDELGEEEQNAH